MAHNARKNSRRSGRSSVSTPPTERQIAYLATLLGSQKEAEAFAANASRAAVSAKISELNFALLADTNDSE